MQGLTYSVLAHGWQPDQWQRGEGKGGAPQGAPRMNNDDSVRGVRTIGSDKPKRGPWAHRYKFGSLKRSAICVCVCVSVCLEYARRSRNVRFDTLPCSPRAPTDHGGSACLVVATPSRQRRQGDAPGPSATVRQRRCEVAATCALGGTPKSEARPFGLVLSGEQSGRVGDRRDQLGAPSRRQLAFRASLAAESKHSGPLNSAACIR